MMAKLQLKYPSTLTERSETNYESGQVDHRLGRAHHDLLGIRVWSWSWMSRAIAVGMVEQTKQKGKDIGREQIKTKQNKQK